MLTRSILVVDQTEASLEAFVFFQHEMVIAPQEYGQPQWRANHHDDKGETRKDSMEIVLYSASKDKAVIG